MTRLHRFHHFSDIRHAVIVSIVLIDQIHHNLRHHVFFLRAALGNHQRQGDQCIVIQKARTVSTVKNPIVFQEPKEQESGDTLVTVAERMVFNRQIEQISRLLLNARIEGPPAERLVNCASWANSSLPPNLSRNTCNASIAFS